MIGTTEVLLIAGIALLLFGGKKLPELMRGMGRGMRIFREEMNTPSQAEPHNGPDKDGAEANSQRNTGGGSPNGAPSGSAAPPAATPKPNVNTPQPYE